MRLGAQRQLGRWRDEAHGLSAQPNPPSGEAAALSARPCAGLEGAMPPPGRQHQPTETTSASDGDARRGDSTADAPYETLVCLPELRALLTVERVVDVKPERGRRSSLSRCRRVGSLAKRLESAAQANACADGARWAADGPSVQALRHGSAVLIKWSGLDYSELSWETWRTVRRLRGAPQAWARCYELMASPPLPAPTRAQRLLAMGRQFRAQSASDVCSRPGRSLRDYQLEVCHICYLGTLPSMSVPCPCTDYYCMALPGAGYQLAARKLARRSLDDPRRRDGARQDVSAAAHPAVARAPP